MRVVDLAEIRRVLPSIDVVGAMEEGFVAYSAGKAVVPPVGELLLDQPPGEVHIKYGYLEGGEHYVIKVASGFPRNPALGRPANDGLMMLFERATGVPSALLMDEGYLTDLRTAAAGAVAAKHLAPSRVERIGIVGSGVQARLQLELLAGQTDCREVAVWGRTKDSVEAYVRDVEPLGFNTRAVPNAADILSTCNLVVTTTPSKAPLLRVPELRPGTHITAVGSDTPHKQELDAAILARADVVVADSVAQCRVRGEIARAAAAGAISGDDTVELGAVIAGSSTGRTRDDQITVADLTGVAVQDIQIAQAVFDRLR